METYGVYQCSRVLIFFYVGVCWSHETLNASFSTMICDRNQRY